MLAPTARLLRFRPKPIARSGPDRASTDIHCFVAGRLRAPRAIATSAFPYCEKVTDVMRAEVETLVEEIKQSVGLLRRHL
jgi:hypothetical protein